MSDETRRLVRTLVQLVVGLAASMPVLLDAAGIEETAAGAGLALAVSAGITRVMSLPGVQRALPGWLRVTPPLPPESERVLKVVPNPPNSWDAS